MMADQLRRYDAEKDELVPVTQEWVNEAQSALTAFGVWRKAVRDMVNSPLVKRTR
jgi:hypothetical protein